jgi:hypothetical protein
MTLYVGPKSNDIHPTHSLLSLPFSYCFVRFIPSRSNNASHPLPLLAPSFIIMILLVPFPPLAVNHSQKTCGSGGSTNCPQSKSLATQSCMETQPQIFRAETCNASRGLIRPELFIYSLQLKQRNIYRVNERARGCATKRKRSVKQ